jgi:hypothetical protein
LGEKPVALAGDKPVAESTVRPENGDQVEANGGAADASAEMPAPDPNADYVTFFDRELDTAGVRLVVESDATNRSGPAPIEPGKMDAQLADLPRDVREALVDITGDRD